MELNNATGAIARLRSGQFALILSGIVLLWPALLNGSAFIFPDTTAYVRGVDAAVVRATGYRTAWTNVDVVRVARAPAPATAARKAAASTIDGEAKPVLRGRSIFYGVVPFAGVIAGSLWVAIVLQALLAGAMVLGFTRHFVDPRSRHFALAVIGANVALATTPLAWFTGMLMPDFLTGIGIAAAAALIVGWRRETRAGRWFWFGLATYCTLAHSSHVLILLAIALVAGVASLAGLSGWRRGAGAVSLAAAIGLIGEAGFAAAVSTLTGTAPIRPPFVTARLVEDGPGTAYLRGHCDKPVFLLCRYRDRLPLNSDGFLWSEQASSGVFKTIPINEQRILADEQTRFVAAVIADRPVEVFETSLDAIWRQLKAWRLVEFNYGAADAGQIIARLPAADRSTFVSSRAYAGTMPITAASLAIPVWTLAGLVAIGIALRRRETRTAGCYYLLMIVGWLADVVVCGAMSTPHDRYQTRVIWLFALAAIALLPGILAGRRGSPAPDFAR